MTPEQSRQVEDLFHAALEREAEARAAFLGDACRGDPALRAEVEELVIAFESAPTYLEEPGCGTLSLKTKPSDATRLLDEGPSLAGERIGAWQLVSKIAEGGMGTVYLAHRADGQYEKRVAIKLIRQSIDTDDPVRSEKVVRRFRDELQHHANLDHPNVAKLLDGGTTQEGRLYLVMEFVEGRSIDEFCRSRQLPLRQRLRLFRTVCMAVQHAHSRFVAHCDIKPSNILVSAGPKPGDEPVPKLVDFGIARLMKQAENGRPQAATVTRVRPMTPQYASPEQVCNAPITAASDIYSLGVVLYQLITGQLPYDVTEYDAKRVICEQPPKKPRSIQRALHREVETIVLKALEKDPARRYASPAALADDIERHLTGRPILAHAQSPLYSIKKFVGRHRSRIAAVLFLIVFGIAIGVLIGELAKVEHRRQAEARRGFVFSLLDSMGRRAYLEAVALEGEADPAKAGESTAAVPEDTSPDTAADTLHQKAQAKFTDALACFRGALEMEPDAPAGDTLASKQRRAELQSMVGHCLLKLGRFQEAVEPLTSSFTVFEARHPDPDPRSTRQICSWIVETCEALGDQEKATVYRAKLLSR